MKPRRAVFLDRDGTLNPDRPGWYLTKPSQMRVYRRVPAALKLLRESGYRLVVVTNQSGLGRGYLDEATLGRIHAKLKRLLARGGARLDGIFYCPHHPDVRCACRKPKALLARRAARALGLTLKGSVVIGDKPADMGLARALGVPGVLVLTGHGRHFRAASTALKPVAVRRDLLSAARWLTRNSVFPTARALAALFCLSVAASAAPPVPITSATVKAPSDLVRGVVPVQADWTKVNFFPETLSYEVKWGVVSMGTSDVAVREVVDFNGQPAYHIVSTAKTTGFGDRFYKVRDVNESWMHVGDFRSLGYSKKLREGNFFRDEWVVFDYDNKGFLAKRVNKDESFSYSTGTIPGAVQDILSSIYLLRPRKLAVGDEVVLDVNTRSNWPLTIKVLRKHRVKVPAGTFSCVVVEPILRGEGIFIQKGRALQVWLTDDERHIPVLMQVDILIGSISAYLTKLER